MPTDAQLAAAVAAERERCCQDVCDCCRLGDVPFRVDILRWVHGYCTDRSLSCAASAMHERAMIEAARSGADQEAQAAQARYPEEGGETR